jgi:hypothetical protein
MQSVEIRIKQADLAKTLAAMREWLDSQQCTLSNFRHKSNGAGIVVINADFSNHACAVAFGERFRVPLRSVR